MAPDLEDIYDLFGLRIITHSRNDCYRALGVVHDVFTPVAERFKDYIATPKSNMYQSLHTTVLTDCKARMASDDKALACRSAKRHAG